MQMCFLTLLCSTFQEIFLSIFVAWLSTHNGCIRVIPLLIQHLASTERSAIAAWPRRMSEFLLNHAQKQTMRFNKRVLLLFRNQLRQTQKFCVKLWEDWKSHTEQATNITIGQITQLSTADLQLWMSKFVSEIRKRDGNK